MSAIFLTYYSLKKIDKLLAIKFCQKLISVVIFFTQQVFNEILCLDLLFLTVRGIYFRESITENYIASLVKIFAGSC